MFMLLAKLKYEEERNKRLKKMAKILLPISIVLICFLFVALG